MIDKLQSLVKQFNDLSEKMSAPDVVSDINLYSSLAAIDILSSELAIKNQRKSREKLRRLKIQLDDHRGEDGACPNSNRLPLGD